MSNLLKAGFFRLRKSSIYWMFVILTIVIAIFNLIKFNNTEFQTTLIKVLNDYIIYIGIFIAIFISIFVGKEYSDGIIRNKIIVGHSRISIYLSKLLLSIIASIFCELIYVFTVYLIGIHIYKSTQLSISQILLCILNSFLVIVEYCSIFNFITMNSSEITFSTVASIIIFIAICVIEQYFGYIANSQKFINNTFIDENGNEQIISQEPNPNYPGDSKVKIAKIVYYSIPLGQANKISNLDFESLNILPIFSISAIFLLNLLGIFLFLKKEIK